VVLGESLFKTKEHGNEFASKWAHVITVSNGKVKHFQDYVDTAASSKAFKAR
jgi:ketosteroid isomerase-like protein